MTSDLSLIKAMICLLLSTGSGFFRRYSQPEDIKRPPRWTRTRAGAYAFDFEGLQAEREFYSPVYTSSTQQNNRIPDFRSVLYWKPILEISSPNDEDISFYTSDETGSFIVVIQGATADGVAGAGTFTFKVSDH